MGNCARPVRLHGHPSGSIPAPGRSLFCIRARVRRSGSHTSGAATGAHPSVHGARGRTPATCSSCSAPASPAARPSQRTYGLEYPIRGDVALMGAHRADRMGNLVYRKAARGRRNQPQDHDIQPQDTAVITGPNWADHADGSGGRPNYWPACRRLGDGHRMIPRWPPLPSQRLAHWEPYPTFLGAIGDWIAQASAGCTQTAASEDVLKIDVRVACSLRSRLRVPDRLSAMSLVERSQQSRSWPCRPRRARAGPPSRSSR